MKRLAQALLLISSVAVASGSLYLITGILARKMRLHKISDEGYETAHDILYPYRIDKYKLHFGPVLPER